MTRDGAVTDLRFSGHDGVVLAASGFGDATAQPVLLLHGSGQTRRTWYATGKALAAAGAYAVTVDLRGHGESGWGSGGGGSYRTESFTADIEAVASTFATPPVIAGSSLGGTIALLIAAGGRIPVAGIILIEMVLRTAAQGVDRILTFMRRGAAGFATLDEAADAIAAFLPNRKRPMQPDGLMKNMRRGPDERWYWHWDPLLLEGMDVDALIADGTLTRAASTLTIPVLLLRGRESDVVTEQLVAEFLEVVPHAAYISVAGAGHGGADEGSNSFTPAITDFVAGLKPSPSP